MVVKIRKRRKRRVTRRGGPADLARVRQERKRKKFLDAHPELKEYFKRGWGR